MTDEQYKQLRQDIDDVQLCWLLTFALICVLGKASWLDVITVIVLVFITRKSTRLFLWGWNKVRTRVRKPKRPSIPQPPGVGWVDNKWQVWACSVCGLKGPGELCRSCNGEMACRPARMEDMPRP